MGAGTGERRTGRAALAAVLVFVACAVACAPAGEVDVQADRQRLDDTASSPASLVVDLRTTEGQPLDPEVDWLLPDGERLFFSARTPDHGRELWVTDGTLLGTRRLTDGNPGEGHMGIDSLVRFGEAAFLLGGNGHEALRLWRTDGTEEGTFPVMPSGWGVPIVNLFGAGPGGGAQGTGIGGRQPTLIPTPSRVVFPGVGGELWSSDGTATDIRQLLPGWAGPPGVYAPTPWGAYLGVSGPGLKGLVRTDGTPEGTFRLPDTCPDGSTSVIENATYVEGRVYFGDCGELWVSDGTQSGTVRLHDDTDRLYHSPELPFMTFGGAVLYWRKGATTSQPILWRSDGTPAGTTSILPLARSQLLAGVEIPAPEPTLVFNAGEALWRSDGTAQGTTPVHADPALSPRRPTRFRAHEGIAYFLANYDYRGGELWRTDGTEAGTYRLTDSLGRPFEGFNHLEIWQDRMVFAARVAGGHRDLWTSDGTPEGTKRILQLPSTSRSSRPERLTPFQGGVLFDAVGESGKRTLWFSDGRPERTVDLGPPVSPGHPSSPVQLGDHFYFAGGEPAPELWRSNGLPSGTSLVARLADDSPEDDAHCLTARAGRLYFVFRNSLWTSDGTELGTRDLGTRVESHMCPFLAEDGTLLLSAFTPDAGTELWTADGTGEGAQRVADIAPGTRSSYPAAFVQAQGRVLFMAGDGTHGEELWRTDGTGAGTQLIADVAPGVASSHPRELTALGELVLFTADDGAHGLELWQSDGTGGGTQRVADLNPGAAASRPELLTTLGDALYFRATDGTTGMELWSLESPGAAPRLVADVRPGPLGSLPRDLVALEPDALVFSADDGVTGREVWFTSDRGATVSLLQDIAPGAASSNPRNFVRSGDQLFFVADDGERGAELWSVPVRAVLERIPPQLECPGRLELEEHDARRGVEFPVVLATDNLDPAPVVTYEPPSGSPFAPGRTQVVVRARDRVGNEASCSFEVEVSSAPGGCGCRSGQGVGGGLLMLLAVVALWTESSARRRLRRYPRALSDRRAPMPVSRTKVRP